VTTILDDALREPNAFCWFGAISAPELEVWAHRNCISLPKDLMDFWHITGGGDLFESETILRPNVASRPSEYFTELDDTDTTNDTAHRACGMPEHFFLFQVGAFHSAVDLRTGKYVTLSESQSIESEFASLEDWYLRTLRAEFGARYGLH
jgi:hypothetical protein